MEQQETYYDVLGVSRNAEEVTIKASYRALAQKYHPDKNSDPSAALKMAKINLAYEVLSNIDARREYNLYIDDSSASDRRPSSSEKAVRPSEREMTLAEYIDSCGVNKISSETVFFAPNIPDKKIQGAISTYAVGLPQSEIIILIDDTIFGSGKNGMLITAEWLIFKQKFSDVVSFRLDEIREFEIDREDSSIRVNGQTIGSLYLPEKLSYAYVAHSVSSFLRIQRQNEINEVTRPVDFADEEKIKAILLKHATPIAKQLETDLAQFNGRYPNFFIGDEIPDKLARIVRFVFVIPRNDRLLGIVDLHYGEGEALVFTNRGIYSRSREFDFVTSIFWPSLRDKEVLGEFEKSSYCGVVFKDGTKVISGRLNVILKPFGVPLFRDLITFALIRQ